MDKSLVDEGAGEEDVYEHYQESLGGLNIPNDEVSEEIKHLRLITTTTLLQVFWLDLIMWMVQF